MDARSIIPNFDIEKARNFAKVSEVTRTSQVITDIGTSSSSSSGSFLGSNSQVQSTEEILIPAATVRFIMDQLEVYYVPEKFI